MEEKIVKEKIEKACEMNGLKLESIRKIDVLSSKYEPDGVYVSLDGVVSCNKINFDVLLSVFIVPA